MIGLRKLRFAPLVYCFICSMVGFSQDDTLASKDKFKFRTTGGFGVSFFIDEFHFYDSSIPYDYSTEFRITGFGIHREDERSFKVKNGIIRPMCSLMWYRAGIAFYDGLLIGLAPLHPGVGFYIPFKNEKYGLELMAKGGAVFGLGYMSGFLEPFGVIYPEIKVFVKTFYFSFNYARTNANLISDFPLYQRYASFTVGLRY